jgi:hypothetical protein
MSAPPPQVLCDFPVLQGVMESYRRSFAHLQYFLVAALIPAVLSLGIAVVSLRTTINFANDPENGSSFAVVLLVLLAYVPYVIFAVAWFRLALLGEEVARPMLFTGWYRRHWRFLRLILAMLLLTMLVGALGGLVFSVLLFGLGGVFSEMLQDENTAIFLFGVAGVIVGLVAGIVVLRMSFVFPAVSVDEDYKMAMSWRHTKGQGWRLLCALTLAATPFFLLSVLLNGLLGVPLDIGGGEPVGFGAGFYLMQAINVILGYMLTAVSIELISLAFRICTGWIPADHGAMAPSRDQSSS